MSAPGPDSSRAIGVVLDRGDLRGHGVLRPLEVDGAVAALVPAALVAGGDTALVVAAALPLRGPDQALLGLALGDLLKRGDRAEAAPWARRLVLAEGHQCALLRRAGHVRPVGAGHVRPLREGVGAG